MKVLTKEISELFNQAIEVFEAKSGMTLKESNKPDFFRDFAIDIENETNFKLSSETLYKQYFIKLKTHSSHEIGYSINYLDAISQYIRRENYMDSYSFVSDDLSEIPEFPYPPHIPCFPSTPAIKLSTKGFADGFNDVWIKDESHNPLGTHKDRMAWEVYLLYNQILKEQLKLGNHVTIPRLSLLSSGNAALSIQYLLQSKGFPSLKILLDNNIDERYLAAIKNSGCEVYFFDWNKKRVSSKEILAKTNNVEGEDLTFSARIKNIKTTFYDWLSYEILNLNPQNVFVPYGSGDLYRNILNIWHKEAKTKKNSKRFFGNKNILFKSNFFAAYTNNKDTQMKMLYAPFDNFESDEEVKSLYETDIVGKKSSGIEVQEKLVKEALDIFEDNKISSSPSGAAGLALFLDIKSQLNPNEKHIIVNTGRMKIEEFE